MNRDSHNFGLVFAVLFAIVALYVAVGARIERFEDGSGIVSLHGREVFSYCLPLAICNQE